MSEKNLEKSLKILGDLEENISILEKEKALIKIKEINNLIKKKLDKR